MQEEPFAPIFPIIGYDSVGPVIQMANDTPYGLAAYALTRRLDHAIKMAESMEAGLIGINDCSPAAGQGPFGGMKASSTSREGWRQGFEGYYETKFISFAILVLSLMGPSRGIGFSLAMMFLAGIGMGFTYAMPYAMVPDAIDYNYMVTGEQSEGAFYGIWTFGIQIGQALALGITGMTLSVTGYIPDILQTETARWGICLLPGPIPAVAFILALIALAVYPINEKRYLEIRNAIQAANET